MLPIETEQFYDRPDVLKRTGWSDPTLGRRMANKEFPRPTHRRGRRLYWLRSEVESALQRLAVPEPIAG